MRLIVKINHSIKVQIVCAVRHTCVRITIFVIFEWLSQLIVVVVLLSRNVNVFFVFTTHNFEVVDTFV